MSSWKEWKESLDGAAPWDLLDKEKYADEEDAEKRFAICKVCPELIKLTKQCKKCGCFMVAKTKLAAATCPLGKW